MINLVFLQTDVSGNFAMTTTIKILFIFAVTLCCFSCKNKNKNRDEKYPYESKEFSFIDTLGKTYFIFKTYSDPSEWSDDETTGYLTFEIENHRDAFYLKDNGLRKMNCMYYSMQFLLMPIDTSYTYIKKGLMYGNKINEDTWQIVLALEAPNSNKISFKELFTRSKRTIRKMEDGRIAGFW